MSFHTSVAAAWPADLVSAGVVAAEADVYTGRQPEAVTRTTLSVWLERLNADAAGEGVTQHPYLVHVRSGIGNKGGNQAGQAQLEAVEAALETVRERYDGKQPFVATVTTILAVEAGEVSADLDPGAKYQEGTVRVTFFAGEAAVASAAETSGAEPSALDGIELLFDASTDGALTLSTSPYVSSWDDESDNDLDVAQADSSKQPQRSTFYSGNRYAVDFDGSDDILAAEDLVASGGDKGSLWAVVEFGELSAAVHSFFAITLGSGTSGDYFVAYAYKVGSSYFLGVSMRHHSGTVTIARGSTALEAGKRYLLEVHSDGSAYELVVNGKTETLTIVSGTNDGYWPGERGVTWGDVSIGANKDGVTEAQHTDGLIAYVAYRESATATSAAQKTAARNALSAKWGI